MDLIEEIEQAKKYLEDIEVYETAIKNKQIEKKQLEDLSTSITAPTDREAVQTSGVSDKVGNCATRIADLIGEIETVINEYLVEKSKRIKVIDSILFQNVTQYDLLFKHYVEFKDLTDIAPEIKVSYPYALELHREALKKVAKILRN